MGWGEVAIGFVGGVFVTALVTTSTGKGLAKSTVQLAGAVPAAGGRAVTRRIESKTKQIQVM